MSFRRLGVCAGVAVAVLVLAGCGPQSVAGGTTEMPEVLSAYAGERPAVWFEPDRLVVILGGSSSCPSVVTRVQEIDDIAILTAETAGGPLCTTDMLLVPTYFELESRPDEVVIEFGSEQYRYDVIDGD